MSQIKRILLVGHCGFDGPQIATMVRKTCPGVQVDDVHSADQLQKAGSDTLLLINRQLGFGFGADTGVGLIEQLAQRENPPVMLLISNYEDAQEAAVAAGARPGFGKAALHDAKTKKLLQDLVGTGAATPAPH